MINDMIHRPLLAQITTLHSILFIFALLCLPSTPQAWAGGGEDTPNGASTLVEPYIPNAHLVDPASTATLSLDELLVFADKNAPAILIARAEFGRTDADKSAAEPLFLENPTLGLAAGPRILNGDPALSFEVSLAQTIDISGARGLNRDAVHAAEQVALARVNEARWAIHVETHALYHDLLINTERRAQAQRFGELAKSLRDIAQRRIDAGESSPLTLLATDADLARAGTEVSRAQQDAIRLRAELAALIGWPSASIPPVTGDLPPVRPAPETPSLLEKMQQNHPQLRTRKLANLLAERRIEFEDRQAWPDPTIAVSYAQEGEPSGEPAPQTWMLSVSVPIPLWQRNQGPRQHAQADLAVARQQHHAAALKLRAELTAAASALTASAQRVEQYQRAVIAPLEQNLDLLQRAFELGEVDVYQVSQTRESLLDAYAHYLDARHEYYQAAALLEGLVGAELWTSKGSAP